MTFPSSLRDSNSYLPALGQIRQIKMAIYSLGEVVYNICSISVQQEAKIHSNVWHGNQRPHYIGSDFAMKENCAKTPNSLKDANFLTRIY